MKKKLKVYTRQNSTGNWWCNTTLNGFDVSTEGKSIEEARLLMCITLKHNGIESNVDWRSPVTYNTTTHIAKSLIGYNRIKLDHLK